MASRPAAPPLLPRVAPDAEPVAPDASVERAHAWRPPWRAAAIVLGAWTLVALVGTQQALLSMWRNGEPLDWWPQLRWNLTSCWMWALFTPPMIWLARRYSFTDERRGAVLVHVIAALAFAALDAAITWALLPWLSKGLMAQQPTVATLFIRGLFINVTSYVCVVAVTLAVEYARLYRERTVAAARLSAQLTEARLQTLQMQLRPHFLFNTLNTIAEQLHTDPHGADRMITRLGTLLRASFASGGEEVPLREELDLLGSYLEIVRTRFRDRLQVTLEVDPDALDALVPRFLLQPVVENAVRHGIEPLERGGTITIAARRRTDTIVLEVRDSGRGLPQDVTESGVGLRNTRDRMRQLYGEHGRLVLRNRVDGGAIAELTVPYRSATEGR